MLTFHFTYLQSIFCQNTAEPTGVVGMPEVVGSPGVIEAAMNIKATEVLGAPELIETPGVTVTSSETIANWRHVRQEQDEEYEESLQLDQEKVLAYKCITSSVASLYLLKVKNEEAKRKRTEVCILYSGISTNNICMIILIIGVGSKSWVGCQLFCCFIISIIDTLK